MDYFINIKAQNIYDLIKHEVVVERDVNIFESLEEKSVELDLRKLQVNLLSPLQLRKQLLLQQKWCNNLYHNQKKYNSQRRPFSLKD